MGYTRAQILEKCKEAFRNKNTFYKKDFINYRGKTSDTEEYYTEVVAEFLCNHITDYMNGINSITRKSSYKTEGHDGNYNPDSTREEEIIAMQTFRQSKDCGPYNLIGEIIDYQTPLKSSADDEAGKIDLLSFDGSIMRILELKKPDSKETMLRCVLEGYTYLKTVDTDKMISDFEYTPENVVIKASPLVFWGSEQYKEMKQARPYLQKLMTLLDSRPFYIMKKEKYMIVEK